VTCWRFSKARRKAEPRFFQKRLRISAPRK
jgi:hypothetical protein